jgi:hypothetical protein
MPGKSYLVGERGPERLVMGRDGGTIIPNQAPGRTQNITIRVAPPQGMTRQASSQVGADIARQLAVADRRNN